MAVIQKLDQLPSNIDEITREQIVAITEPLIGGGTPDEMMALAKTTSRALFVDVEASDRVQMINNLVIYKKCIINVNVFRFISFFGRFFIFNSFQN